ncbi:MAG: 1-phosphofructokinase family hexose kinase [Beijerinckiaceae bacterium]|nr:1-phosphofructokinase family hexose kinase [Beijerinckiaceae bacterium]
MTPIVTLTLNPAIDGACEADVVRPIHKVRTRNERYDPGGGGINVSRVVRELGGDTLAVYLAGGATGSVFDALIDAAGVPRRRIDITGHTRISNTVFETSSGHEFRFVPEGPLVEHHECARSLEALKETAFDWLVASGSLPRGIKAGFYPLVGEIAKARGAHFVLDTSGDALKAALDAGGVHLAKPSLGEFEALVGAKLEDPAAQDRAAHELAASGKVALLAITLGRDGALLADGEGVFRMPALPVEARSAVGAGDSFLAAMTLALARGRPAREAFVRGVAAGTAAVLTPGTELCRRSDVNRLFADAMKIASELGAAS